MSQPNLSDVLFGRGNFAKNHPGNRRYRQVVNQFRSAWRSTNSRKERTDISAKVIHEIQNGHPPGKFVKYDKHASVWKEVPFQQALVKTQKALRESVFTEEDTMVEESRGFSAVDQRIIEASELEV